MFYPCQSSDPNEDDGPCIEFATSSPITREVQTTLALLSPHQSFDVTYFTSYEQYQQWRKEPQEEHSIQVERADGTTLVFCGDPTNGCYIALFDQHGGNLQHINLDNEELALIKSWVNGLPVQNPTPEEEAYCDDHAYDVDTDIPVIRNWNDQCTLSEEEIIEAERQHWLDRKAIEAGAPFDYSPRNPGYEHEMHLW